MIQKPIEVLNNTTGGIGRVENLSLIIRKYSAEEVEKIFDIVNPEIRVLLFKHTTIPLCICLSD